MSYRVLALSSLVAAIHCSSSSSAPPSAGPGTDGGANADANAPADAGARSLVVPIEVRSYRALGGKFLRASVVVNGSAPIPVLLDTGSTGLRVFASALGSTFVEDTGKTESIDFGGNVLAGKQVRAVVALGGAATPSPIVLERVDAVSCAPGATGCEASAGEKAYTDDGIFGILGIGLRPDPSGIVSPLAQLEGDLARGYALRTGGFDSTAGELVLGADLDGSFRAVGLTRAGALPNGAPAWADDAITVCYALDGSPVDPPCSDTVFDTGSNMDVAYAKNVAPAKVTNDGMLAQNVAFRAKRDDGALDFELRVGSPVTVSKDAVLVQADDRITILGIGLFFRYDTVFDIAGGRIGLKPR